MGALIEEISASIVRRRSTGWAPAQTCSAPTCSVSDTVATSRRVRSHVMTMTTFAALQDVIERTYGERDRERGVSATVAWLAEEIGELAQAVRKGTHEDKVHEFGDVVAWVATLANQQGVDLTEAIQRYADGCPKCAAIPCACT